MADQEEAKKIEFVCCFCYESIEDRSKMLGVGIFEANKPIFDEDEDDHYQQWFAHGKCFKEALHESMREEIREELQEVMNETPTT